MPLRTSDTINISISEEEELNRTYRGSYSYIIECPSDPVYLSYSSPKKKNVSHNTAALDKLAAAALIEVDKNFENGQRRENVLSDTEDALDTEPDSSSEVSQETVTERRKSLRITSKKRKSETEATGKTKRERKSNSKKSRRQSSSGKEEWRQLIQWEATSREKIEDIDIGMISSEFESAYELSEQIANEPSTEKAFSVCSRDPLFAYGGDILVFDEDYLHFILKAAVNDSNLVPYLKTAIELLSCLNKYKEE